jgi:DNA-binding CsgD family transcriptional regulator/anti-sigma regulatory factor (Ser/Thr protein kinase)
MSLHVSPLLTGGYDTADDAVALPRPGHAPMGAESDTLAALADMVCASTEEMAERLRTALTPVLPHQATILITPTAEVLPVRIAAPAPLQERLAEIDWLGIAATALRTHEGATRALLPDVIAGMRAVGWTAGSAGTGVLLIIAAQHKVEIGPAQERTARLATMLAAARARGIGQAPSPGTLAFSHAISQERDRVRWELASNHAATLAVVLKTLRDAAQTGTRSTPSGLAVAIDLASQALLEVNSSAQRQDAALYVSCADAFATTDRELRELVRASGLRLVNGLDGAEDGVLQRAIARAAQIVSCAAALNATRHPGADKVRVHWRLRADALLITVSDNGEGFRADDHQVRRDQAHLARRVAGLGGIIRFDTALRWGTTVTCTLPVRAPALVPETAAAEQIAQLRPREREVLELMVAGLRNREIAERLYIAVRTVKFHVSNILRKFGASSRAEVIVLAHNAGITAQQPS